jgi:hypothetical protein
MTAIQRYEGPGGLAETMKVGEILSKSGFFADSREAAQAITKILAGQEMGIGAIAAMTGIYIVKGRVTLSANLMASQIKRSGRYNYRVARLDDTGCEIVFFEGAQEIGRSSFTSDDAKAAGLWNSSDPWKKTPRNMLFARAISNGAKWYTPDVFSGPVYTPDELSSEPTIDVTPPTASPEPARKALPPAPPVDKETGEVHTSFDTPAATGTASGVKLSPNSKGEMWISFAVEGANKVITAKAIDFPGLEYLDDGDMVYTTYTPKSNKGKIVNVLETIQGNPNADGLSPWEQRASEERVNGEDGAPDGATFTAIEVPEEEPA